MSTDSMHSVLFRHSKRPSWGLALLAWDQVDRRGYQFEDGKLRVFKRGYFGLLEEVDPPADVAHRVLDRLNRALGRSQAASERQELLIPFAAQVAYFKELYPEGFHGAVWTGQQRGVEAKRPLKRHRDPAMKHAREQLAAEVLRRNLAEGRYEEVVDGLLAVLERTSLVSAARLRPLRSLPPHRRQAVAVALRSLLHDDGVLEPRLEAFIVAVGDPSWELATAPLALIDPEQHVCVTPSVFDQQALWMAPRLDATKTPDPHTYRRYLKMARDVRGLLEEADLRPRDLLDVHDFIHATLRPAARQQLAERATGRRSEREELAA